MQTTKDPNGWNDQMYTNNNSKVSSDADQQIQTKYEAHLIFRWQMEASRVESKLWIGCN